MCNRLFPGQDHVLLATTYNNIGVVYFHMRKPLKACENYKASFKMFKKLYPDSDPNVVRNNWNSAIDQLRQLNN